MEDEHGVRSGVGGWPGASPPSPAAPPSQHITVFTDPETPQTLSFGGFVEVLLHRHYGLSQNCGLLVIEPNCQPSNQVLGLSGDQPSR